MSNSICRFMPTKNGEGNIKTINFVLETDFKHLRQPFFRAIHVMNLITKGSGSLKLNGHTYELHKGDLFFAFPACPFEILGSDDFEYMYISFMGSYVTTLFEDLKIGLHTPVYRDFGHLEGFWRQSIKRVNQLNANLLTESVLLYTLSYINNTAENVKLKKKNENLFSQVVDYIDTHFTDPDMCLKKVADIFSYTEKYLSHFFKKNMEVGFNSYLTNLRMQYALELLENNEHSISKVAAQCGFTDALYFSKVFKQSMGCPPTEYLQRHPAAGVSLDTAAFLQPYLSETAEETQS